MKISDSTAEYGNIVGTSATNNIKIEITNELICDIPSNHSLTKSARNFPEEDPIRGHSSIT